MTLCNVIRELNLAVVPDKATGALLKTSSRVKLSSQATRRTMRRPRPLSRLRRRPSPSQSPLSQRTRL